MSLNSSKLRTCIFTLLVFLALLSVAPHQVYSTSSKSNGNTSHEKKSTPGAKTRTAVNEHRNDQNPAHKRAISDVISKIRIAKEERDHEIRTIDRKIDKLVTQKVESQKSLANEKRDANIGTTILLGGGASFFNVFGFDYIPGLLDVFIFFAGNHISNASNTEAKKAQGNLEKTQKSIDKSKKSFDDILHSHNLKILALEDTLETLKQENQ